MGPLEVLVIECHGERLTSTITLALRSAVDSGRLRIIDVRFVYRDLLGAVTNHVLADRMYDLGHLGLDETPNLLAVSDIELIGQRGISLDSSAVVMIVERAGTRLLERAVLAVGARIVAHGRVPPDVAIAALNEPDLLWRAQETDCVCESH